nr:ROK family protein [Citrobacter freundii]
MFYGVDIGGTKTEIVAFDKEMQVCWRKRVATPVQDYELFLSTFTSLIDTADWATGTQGKIGIGMPGLMDRHTPCFRWQFRWYRNKSHQSLHAPE